MMEQVEIIKGQDVCIRSHGDNSIGIYYSNGRKKEGVKPRRLFTISMPYSYIQMLDEDGSEIGILQDMKDLDCKSKKHLTKVLDRFYVIPKITEINDLHEEYRITRWDVETDRGNRIFYVRSRNTDIHLLGQGRVLIRDADNNRYEIPDYRKLSKKSRQLLEGEI